MIDAEREAKINSLIGIDAAGRTASFRALAAALIDSQAREAKLIEQLDGWATLLRIGVDYWQPAEPISALSEGMRQFFFSLNDYGRTNALKGSLFNQECLALRKTIEAECDRQRQGRLEALRALEDAKAELTAMTATADAKHEALWDYRRMCEKHGIPDSADEVVWLDKRLTLMKLALVAAEDFVVTHAAQGDEKVLAVIGTALDGG